MSCDTKILCKALAKRIDSHVPNLIIDDQNGFVLGRQAFHNTRRLLNILFKKQNEMPETMQSCLWMLKKHSTPHISVRG